MIDQSKYIFLVGIKGVAMTNLAVIFKKMGKKVSGSDVEEIFITDQLLEKNNINYYVGFDTKKLPIDVDLVVYSGGHGGINNPQVIEAKKRGIHVISQAEILGQLIKKFGTTIAVCGSHGKTTTSSLLSYALIRLGTRPSYLVGSPSFNEFEGGDYSSKQYFVIEADEYAVNPPDNLTPKFHLFKPNYIICTNIDFDHPDVYKNLEATKKAFLKLFKVSINQLIDTPLILCNDDKNLMSLTKKLPQNKYQTFGFSKKSDYVISNVRTTHSGTQFHLAHNKKSLGVFKILLFGDKNVSNTTSVIVILITLGFSPDLVKKAIQNFRGAKRRFEKQFSNDHFTLYDDYAHHPHEIEATIKAAQKLYPSKRIVVLFQPHTYSRTAALLTEFAKSLSIANLSFVLPIFASARENPSDFNVSSASIQKGARELNLKNVISTDSNDDLLRLLKTRLDEGDVIFTMGAGDVYKLKNDIIDVIKGLP